MSTSGLKDETTVSPTSEQDKEAPQVPKHAGKSDSIAARRHRRRNKKPFTNGHSGQRSILPSTSKTQLVASAQLTTPHYECHPIFISLHGLLSLCIHLHENLRVRDRQMMSITAADLVYTSLVYAITKILRCDASNGYVDEALSILEPTMNGVMFPAIIADYLDSIGKWTMSNGLTIAPSFRFVLWNKQVPDERNDTYIKRHFIHPGLLHPGLVLPEWYHMCLADLQIPTVEPSFVTCERWCLMPDVIQRYRRLIPRMTKSVDMRVPLPSCQGQQNILVCRKTENVDSIIGCAPERLPEETAQVGAVFGWNYFDCRRSWPGDKHLLTPWTSGVTFSLSNARSRIVQTRMKLFNTEWN